MKRKCVKLMKSMLAAALAAAMVITPNMTSFAAGEADPLAAEAQSSSYDDVVNAAHPAWINY